MNGGLIFTGLQQPREFSKGTSFAKSPAPRKPSGVSSGLNSGTKQSACVPASAQQPEPECGPWEFYSGLSVLLWCV